MPIDGGNSCPCQDCTRNREAFRVPPNTGIVFESASTLYPNWDNVTVPATNPVPITNETEEEEEVAMTNCAECRTDFPETEDFECETCHTYPLCDDCYTGHYNCIWCESCGEYHQDGITHDDEDDDYVSAGGSGFVRRSGTVEFLTGEDDLLVVADRHIGVEIEAEYTGASTTTDTLASLHPYCGVGTDGSLTNGVEVTIPPSSGDALATIVKDTTRVMKNSGYGIKDTCGLHIHIDLRDKAKDFKFLSHLFSTLYAVEDILYAMNPPSRRTGQYSHPIRASYPFTAMHGKAGIAQFDYKFYGYEKTMYNSKRYMENEKREHYNGKRYHSMNFHSVFYRGTLEVRMHSGTLDAEKILRWANLMQYIIRWAEDKHSYTKLRTLLSMPVTSKKLLLFQKWFGIPDDLMEYVANRIARFNQMGLDVPYRIY